MVIELISALVGRHRDGLDGSLLEREASRDRQEVYLPRLESSILHDVSGDQPTTIGVDARSAPNLTPSSVSFLSVQVPPGGLLDQAGDTLASGRVGISTVPPELVRPRCCRRASCSTRSTSRSRRGDYELHRAGTDDVSQRVAPHPARS